MAGDTPGGVNYFLSIPRQHQSFVYSVRHWDNLKIAFEGETLWLKDITAVQSDGIEIKAMPFKTLYYREGDYLFIAGSLLRERTIPALLWSHVQRGLPISLPAARTNASLQLTNVAVKICSSEETQNPAALLVDMETLAGYVNTAPAVRLQHLSWVIIKPGRALIIGSPLLPVPGESYWMKGNFLIPSGSDIELSSFQGIIQQELDPKDLHWIWWNRDGNFQQINKQDFRPLSIYSFRKTVWH